jgi:RND family efflux transporter MFP subunit
MKKNPIVKSILVLLLLIVSAGLPVGCKSKPANATTNAASPPPSVTVQHPVTQDVVHYAEFSGTTEAVESVTIQARVEGYLERIHFTEGALVEKGDLLFTIDDQPYRARRDEARAEVAMREAELKLARVTRSRKENALRDRAVSEVEVIDARAQEGKAEAGVAAAKAALRTAQLNLSYTRVTAPLNGRIGRSLVDVGNLVGAGERTKLTTIVKDDPIYAYFTISEREWVRYQTGRSGQEDADTQAPTVYLGLAGGKTFPFEGRLDFVDNQVDASTGTVQMRGIFANQDRRIVPGLFARIKIPVGETADAMLVPDSALARDQQGRFALVAGPNNVTQYRPVTTGELVGGMRVIHKGLTSDARVIVNGIQKARPGSPVTPVEAKSEAAPQTGAFKSGTEPDPSGETS